NLNGAKVRNIGESVKGLAKGIYVVGGKKIVVK
ncbi:MAG: subtilase, partial [Prevotella sp.]|nr:subtilase [Prevotella sp.]MBD9230267.1 subtilase [Prevotella sp.]